MFDFNVDVKITDQADASRSQFINMTIATVPPGAQQLDGSWRGASVFVPSSGGGFIWDGRPGQETAFVIDGPANTGRAARVVLILSGFIKPGGGLPVRGATGSGSVLDPDTPAFTGDIFWLIT